MKRKARNVETLAGRRVELLGRKVEMHGRKVNLLGERVDPVGAKVDLVGRMVRLSVSKPALMARINRMLAKRDEQLRASRSERARSDVGDFYVVDVSINGIVGKDINPAQLARELGVLADFEYAEGFEDVAKSKRPAKRGGSK